MAPVKKELVELGRTYIAEWREYRGMTQEDLADGINMSRSGLSKIETSAAPYTQRTLEAIARVLRCRPHNLLVPLVKDEEKNPEAALRAAMIAFGVDHSQLERLVAVVKTFIPPTVSEAQSGQTQPDDQPLRANHHRAKVPSE